MEIPLLSVGQKYLNVLVYSYGLPTNVDHDEGYYSHFANPGFMESKNGAYWSNKLEITRYPFSRFAII